MSTQFNQPILGAAPFGGNIYHSVEQHVELDHPMYTIIEEGGKFSLAGGPNRIFYGSFDSLDAAISAAPQPKQNQQTTKTKKA